MISSAPRFALSSVLLRLLPVLLTQASVQAADGIVRSYFNPPNTTPAILDARIDSSAKVVAISSRTADGAFRLNPDGVRDTSFASNTYNNSLTSLLIQADGRILVSGLFTLVNGSLRTYIVRLNQDGTLDSAFPSSFGGTGVQVLAPGTGGKFYAGKVNGYGLERYTADGVPDSSFYSPTIGSGQINGKVYAVQELADGKVMVSHQIADPSNGVATGRKLERLTSTGAIDTTFSVPALNAPVENFEILPDGRVAVIGEFTSIGGVARTRLAMLQSDGSLDTSFNPGSGMEFFAADPRFGVKFLNGKLYFYGDITSINGVALRGLARLNPDGSTDSTFAIGAGTNGKVGTLIAAASGDIFVGGGFTTINSQAAYHAAYLDPGTGGSVTDTFTAYLEAAAVPQGKRGPLDDADADGISNLMEYALGLAVMIPDPTGLPSVNKGAALTLTYRQARNDVVYIAETSTSLDAAAPWSSAGVDQGTPGPDGLTTASVPSDGLHRFLRLKITR